MFEGERRDYRTDGKKWQKEIESRCEGGKWLTLRQVASLHRVPVGKRKKEYESRTITADLFISADLSGVRLTQQVVERLLSGV